MRRYGRVVAVQIGGRELRGLRVDFDVAMSSTSSPTEAQIAIFGPSDDTIAAARVPGARVALIAGHLQKEAEIFRGEAIKGGVTYDEGVLTIEAADGLSDLAGRYVARSWAGEIPVERVVREVVGSAGLGIATLRVPPGATLRRGYAAAGPLRRVLDDLAGASGCAWRLVAGALEWHPLGEPARTAREIVLSPDTGLIGSPRAADDGLIEVEVVLDGAIRPATRLRVTSRDYDGPYIAQDVRHRGSSVGGPYSTIATAVPA